MMEGPKRLSYLYPIRLFHHIDLASIKSLGVQKRSYSNLNKLDNDHSGYIYIAYVLSLEQINGSWKNYKYRYR